MYLCTYDLFHNLRFCDTIMDPWNIYIYTYIYSCIYIYIYETFPYLHCNFHTFQFEKEVEEPVVDWHW